MTAPRQKPTGYLPGLDLLRIIASVFVVYLHARDWYVSGQHEISGVDEVARATLFEPFHISGPIGFIALGPFFLISGIVVTQAALKESVPQFLGRRGIRIMPALWVLVLASWLMVLAEWLPVEGGRGELDLPALLANLTFVNFFDTSPSVATVAWTLVVQIPFYFFVAFTIPLLRRWPWLPPAIGIALVSVLLTIVNTEQTPAMHTSRVIIGFAPALFIGQLIGLVRAERLHPVAAVGYGVIQFLLFVRGDLTSEHTPPFDGYPRALVLTLLMVLIFAAIDGPALRGKWIPWTAKRTYAMYLVHIPAMYVPPKLLGVANGSLVAILVGLVALVVLTELLYRYVEAPIARWYRNREKAHQAKAAVAR
ncbi:peptidoglycan/LPS O-acetylase OafA/YrhL [Herbihabitans rhizosphaerae]|uniref:Peptidoglycan/LPS O-acetylase OafA/YrhL n=1 Tax=Herbihabitans rhizosphaerae TaxID=1872711 RepID=A0A4Q7KME4_9PSEU|nr:acyltransferase [Herbihabitans rhizosphaerae]RZS37474.1 peptidoglycan/LPS O-acetylase OafA/YrhL [Herbihabitans rhizosphaerae]